MNDIFSSTYDPKQVEDKIYNLWLSSDSFLPSPNNDQDTYSITMPPPNITGRLHMGHAIFVAIQDLFTRFQRLQGKSVLWLPGTDHASIATQNVVEKKIANQGLSRHDLGREKFLEHVWQWVQEYGEIITSQIKKLGASCDWSRNLFTMDPQANQAVVEAFCQLYEKDLIYKGKYLINWCPRCLTVLADDEVEHEEETTKLYHLKYLLAEPQPEDSIQFLVAATVRPETLLGDVAVAVHPSDERYKHLIGRQVILPIENRPIPIIADHRVDMEFGTGAVKITPAHDFTDYEIGREHDLPLINMLQENGRISLDFPDFADLEVPKARQKMVEALKAADLLDKTEDYTHSIGHCYRCQTIIEPFISTQWFVRTNPMAKQVLQAVQQDKIVFYPDRFTKVFNHWLENFHDWCISRQLWWGHQIPAWYCLDCQQTAESKGEKENHQLYTVVAREKPDHCPHCRGSNLKQDEDVLDTWFSSALWPFSTLGWPEQTQDLNTFY
ncbi:MAG TPA: valine--tRNA ligase, partial [Candidatus Wirthbacteria bacterium]|nr:valine--tRNA ligase [Candidatus Wirthbacteria bacterium]